MEQCRSAAANYMLKYTGSQNVDKSSWQKSIDDHLQELIRSLLPIIDSAILRFKQFLSLEAETTLRAIPNPLMKCLTFVDYLRQLDRETSIKLLVAFLRENSQGGLADRLEKGPAQWSGLDNSRNLTSMAAPPEARKPQMPASVKTCCTTHKTFYGTDAYGTCEALVPGLQPQLVTTIFVNPEFTVYNSQLNIVQQHETLITEFLCKKQFEVTVLVGNASSGKTTVCKKLCSDWLTDNNHTFSLIVVIDCDKLNRKAVDTFEDLLDFNSVFEYPEKLLYEWSTNVSENSVKDWIMKHTTRVLFILDCFEEYINEYNVSYCRELNCMLGLEEQNGKKRKHTWSILVLLRPYPEIRLFCANHSPKACLVKLGGVDTKNIDRILKSWWNTPETQQRGLGWYWDSLCGNDRDLLTKNPVYMFALRDMVLSYATTRGTSEMLTLQAVYETVCNFLLRQGQKRIETRQLLHDGATCSFAMRGFSCCESSFDYDEKETAVTKSPSESFCKRILSELAFNSFIHKSRTVTLKSKRFRKLCPHIALNSGLLIADIPRSIKKSEPLNYIDDSVIQYLAVIYIANQGIFVNAHSNEDPKVYIQKLLAVLFKTSANRCKDGTVSQAALPKKLIFEMTRCENFFRILFAHKPDAFSELLAKELVGYVDSLPLTFFRLAGLYRMRLWYIANDSSNGEARNIMQGALSAFHAHLNCEANAEPNGVVTKLLHVALNDKPPLTQNDVLEVFYGSSVQVSLIKLSTFVGAQRFQIFMQLTPGMNANCDMMFVSQETEHRAINQDVKQKVDIQKLVALKYFFFTGLMSDLICFLSNTKFVADHTTITIVTNEENTKSKFSFSNSILERFQAEHARQIFDLSVIYDAMNRQVHLLIASACKGSHQNRSGCLGIKHYVKGLVLKRSGFIGSPSSFLTLYSENSENELQSDEATVIFRADLGETDPFVFHMRDYTTDTGVVPIFVIGDQTTRKIAITQLITTFGKNIIDVVTEGDGSIVKSKLNLEASPTIVEIVGSLELIFCTLYTPFNQLSSEYLVFLHIIDPFCGHQHFSSIALRHADACFRYQQYGISGTIVLVEQPRRDKRACSVILLSAKHCYDVDADNKLKLEHDYENFHAAYIGPFAGALCAVSSTFFNAAGSYEMHIMFDDIMSDLNKFFFINATCQNDRRISWAVGEPTGIAIKKQKIVIVQEANGLPIVEQQLSTLETRAFTQLQDDIMSAQFLWLHVSLSVFVQLARLPLELLDSTLACSASVCFLQRCRKRLSLKCVTDEVATAAGKGFSFGSVTAYIPPDDHPHSVVRIVYERRSRKLKQSTVKSSTPDKCTHHSIHFVYYGSVEGIMAIIQNQALCNIECTSAEDEELQGGTLNFHQVFDSPIQPPIVCSLLLARLEAHTCCYKFHSVRFMVRELRTNAKTVPAAYECCLTIISETENEPNDEWLQQEICTDCFAFEGQLSLLGAFISSSNVVAPKCIFKITDFSNIDGQKKIETTCYYINDRRNCYRCVTVRNDDITQQACVYCLCSFKKPFPDSNVQVLLSIEEAFPLKAQLCFFHGEVIDLLYIILNNGFDATDIQIAFSSLHGSNSDLFYSCDTAKLQTYCMSLPSVNTVVKVEMIGKLPQQDRHDKIVVIRQWNEIASESRKEPQEDQFKSALKTGKACVAIALNLENTIGVMRTTYHYLHTCYVRLADNEQIIMLERNNFYLKNKEIKFLHYRLPKDPQGPISSLEFYVEDVVTEVTELNANGLEVKYCQTLETNWFEYHGSVSSFCSLLWNKELKVTNDLHLEFWSVTPLIRDEQTTVFSLHCTPAYNSKPISESVYFQLETGVVSMAVIDISHEKWFILYVERDELLPTSKFADIHPIKKRIASAQTGPTLIAYKGSPVLLHDLTTKELIKDNVQIILQLSDSEVSGPLELMPRLQLENGFCYGFKKLYDDKGVFAYFIRQFDTDDSIINNSADRPMENRIHDKLEAKYVYFTGQLEGFSKLAALDDLPDAEYHYITSLDIKHQTSADIEHQRICLKRYIDETTAYKIVKFNDIQSNVSSKTFLTVCCETSDADKKSMEFHELDPYWSQTEHFVYVGKEQNFSDLNRQGITSPQNFFISTNFHELGTYKMSKHFVVTAKMQSVNEANVSFIIKLWYKVQSEDMREININMKGFEATPGKMHSQHLNRFMNTQQVDTFNFEGTVSGLCKMMAQRNCDLFVTLGGTLKLQASDSVPCSVPLSQQTLVHTKMLLAKSWQQGDNVLIYMLELQHSNQVVHRIFHIDHSIAIPQLVCSDGFSCGSSKLPDRSSRCSTLLSDPYGMISAVGYYGELPVLLHILCELTEMKKSDLKLDLHVQMSSEAYLNNPFFSQTSWLAYMFSTSVLDNSKFPVFYASTFQTATLRKNAFSGSVLQSALIVVGKYDTKAMYMNADSRFELFDKDRCSTGFVVYTGQKHALMNALASAETPIETLIAQLDEVDRFEKCRVVSLSNFKPISVTELRQINPDQPNASETVLQRIVRQLVRDTSLIDQVVTMHNAPTIWQLYPESYAILHRLQPEILCDAAHTFQLCHTENNNETAICISNICDPPIICKLSQATTNNVPFSCTIICASAFPISLACLTQIYACDNQAAITTLDNLNNLESNDICFHLDGTLEGLVHLALNKPTTALNKMDRHSTVFVRRKGLSILNEATNVCFNDVQILNGEKYSAQIKSLLFAFEVLRCNEQDFALRMTFVGDNAQEDDASYDMHKHEFSKCKYIEYTGNVLGIIVFYEILVSVLYDTEQHELTLLITDAYSDDSSKCFQTGDYTVCCKKNEDTTFLEFKSEVAQRSFLAVLVGEQSTRANKTIYGNWREYCRIYYSGSKESVCRFLSQLDRGYELLEIGIQKNGRTNHGTVVSGLASQSGAPARLYDVVQASTRHCLLRFVEDGSDYMIDLPTCDGIERCEDFVYHGSIETLRTVSYGCILGSARIELTKCFGRQLNHNLTLNSANMPISSLTNNRLFKTEYVQCLYSECQGYLFTFETDPRTQILYLNNGTVQPTQTCASTQFNVAHFWYSGDLYSLALFVFQFNVFANDCSFAFHHNKNVTRFDTSRITNRIINAAALERKYKLITVGLADDLSGVAELFGIVPLQEGDGSSSVPHINLKELSDVKPPLAKLFIYCGEMHDLAQLVIHDCLPVQVWLSDVCYGMNYVPRKHFTFGHHQRHHTNVFQPWTEKCKIFSTMSVRCIKNYLDESCDTKMIYVEETRWDSQIYIEPPIIDQESIEKRHAECLVLNVSTAELAALASVDIWSHFDKVFFERDKVVLPLYVQTHTILLQNKKCVRMTETVVDCSPSSILDALVFLKSTDVTDLNPHETIESKSGVSTMHLEWFQFSGNILGFCQRFQGISVIEAKTFALRFTLNNRSSDIIIKNSTESYNSIMLKRLIDTPLQCIVQISINNNAAIAMVAGYCQATESNLNLDSSLAVSRVDSQNTFERIVFVGNYCTFVEFVFANPYIEHLWLDFRNFDCPHIDKSSGEIITFAGEYVLRRGTLQPMAFDCSYLKDDKELACLFVRKNDGTNFVPTAEVVNSQPRFLDYTGTIDHFMQLLLHQLLPVPLSKFILHVDQSRTYVLNVSFTDTNLGLTWKLHLADDLSCFILVVVEYKEGAVCSLSLQEHVHNLAYVGKAENFAKLLCHNRILMKDCTIWWSATPYDKLKKCKMEYLTVKAEKTEMQFLICSCNNEDDDDISWVTLRQVFDTFKTQSSSQLQSGEVMERFYYNGSIPAFVDLFALRIFKIMASGGATLTFTDSETLTSELMSLNFNDLYHVSKKARIEERLSSYNIVSVVLAENKTNCAKWIGCIDVDGIDSTVTKQQHVLATVFHSAVPAAFYFTGTKTAFLNFALNACTGDYATSAFCQFSFNDNEQWKLLPNVLQNRWIKYTVTVYNNFTAVLIPHEQLSIIIERVPGVTKSTNKLDQGYTVKYLFYVGSRAGLSDFYCDHTSSGTISDHQLLCTFSDTRDTLQLKHMFSGLYGVKCNLSDHFAFIAIHEMSEESSLFVIIYEINLFIDYTHALACVSSFNFNKILLEQLQSAVTFSHYKGSKYGLSALLSLLDGIHNDNLAVQIKDTADYFGSVSCMYLEQPCQHGTHHSFCAFDIVEQSTQVPVSTVALRFVYDKSARQALPVKPQNSAGFKIKHADQLIFSGPSKRLLTFAKWSSMKDNFHKFNIGLALIYAVQPETLECVMLNAPKITRKDVSLTIPICSIKTIEGLQGYALLYVATTDVTSKDTQVNLRMQEQSVQQFLLKGPLHLLADFLSQYSINTDNLYLLSEEGFSKYCSAAIDLTDNLKTIRVCSKANTQDCLIAGYVQSHDSVSHPNFKVLLTFDRQPMESARMFYYVGDPLTLVALYLTNSLPNWVRNARMSIQDALSNPNLTTEAERLMSMHHIELHSKMVNIVTFTNKPAVEGVQRNYLTYIYDAPEVSNTSDLPPLILLDNVCKLSGCCLIMKLQLPAIVKLCIELIATNFDRILLCYERDSHLYANKVQLGAIRLDTSNNNDFCDARKVPSDILTNELHMLLIDTSVKKDNVEETEIFSLDQINIVGYLGFNGTIFDFCKIFSALSLEIRSGELHFTLLGSHHDRGQEKQGTIEIGTTTFTRIEHFAIKLSHLKIECYSAYSNNIMFAIAMQQCDNDRYNALDNKVSVDIWARQTETSTFCMALCGSYNCFLQLLKECSNLLLTATAVMMKIDGLCDSDVPCIDGIFVLRSLEPEWKDRFQSLSHYALIRDGVVHAIFAFSGIVPTLKVPLLTANINPLFLHFSGDICEFMELLLDNHFPSTINDFTLEFNGDIIGCTLSASDTSAKFCKVNKLLTADNTVLFLAMTMTSVDDQTFSDYDWYRQLTNGVTHIAFTGHVRLVEELEQHAGKCVLLHRNKQLERFQLRKLPSIKINNGGLATYFTINRLSPSDSTSKRHNMSYWPELIITEKIGYESGDATEDNLLERVTDRLTYIGTCFGLAQIMTNKKLLTVYNHALFLVVNGNCTSDRIEFSGKTVIDKAQHLDELTTMYASFSMTTVKIDTESYQKKGLFLEVIEQHPICKPRLKSPRKNEASFTHSHILALEYHGSLLGLASFTFQVLEDGIEDKSFFVSAHFDPLCSLELPYIANVTVEQLGCYGILYLEDKAGKCKNVCIVSELQNNDFPHFSGTMCKDTSGWVTYYMGTRTGFIYFVAANSFQLKSEFDPITVHFTDEGCSAHAMTVEVIKTAIPIKESNYFFYKVCDQAERAAKIGVLVDMFDEAAVLTTSPGCLQVESLWYLGHPINLCHALTHPVLYANDTLHAVIANTKEDLPLNFVKGWLTTKHQAIQAQENENLSSHIKLFYDKNKIMQPYCVIASSMTPHNSTENLSRLSLPMLPDFDYAVVVGFPLICTEKSYLKKCKTLFLNDLSPNRPVTCNADDLSRAVVMQFDNYCATVLKTEFAIIYCPRAKPNQVNMGVNLSGIIKPEIKFATFCGFQTDILRCMSQLRCSHKFELNILLLDNAVENNAVFSNGAYSVQPSNENVGAIHKSIITMENESQKLIIMTFPMELDQIFHMPLSDIIAQDTILVTKSMASRILLLLSQQETMYCRCFTTDDSRILAPLTKTDDFVAHKGYSFFRFEQSNGSETCFIIYIISDTATEKGFKKKIQKYSPPICEARFRAQYILYYGSVKQFSRLLKRAEITAEICLTCRFTALSSTDINWASKQNKRQLQKHNIRNTSFHFGSEEHHKASNVISFLNELLELKSTNTQAFFGKQPAPQPRYPMHPGV